MLNPLREFGKLTVGSWITRFMVNFTIMYRQSRWRKQNTKSKINQTLKMYHPTGLSDEGVRNDLNFLIQNELIKVEGSGRGTYYVLVGD